MYSLIINTFGQLEFLKMLWLLLLAFFIHEIEEWNITDFERRNFVGLPTIVTKRNARMWIKFICLVGLVWCSAATLPGNPTLAAYVFLPAIFLVLGNALQHVFWTFYFRQYAPGVVSAVLLLIPICCYVIVSAVKLGYSPRWYVAAMAVLIVVPLVHTVRAGNEMTPLVRAIYHLGNWLSEHF